MGTCLGLSQNHELQTWQGEAFEGFKETTEINDLLVFPVANLMALEKGEFLQ